ncbi:hypothetical protein F0L68_35610 [Solihabitans fulvus]|uniref:Uncharacterized protein n=1 Tax=Solihabitans fulvus TaxID=1892852 RepID=A0A5B2WPP3_9PSEU|nr:hypothetical protein [Solihabitans fulvus]KAA2252379.1 hypothetical protein F0L68_35610 [Solihabitans fulvus]
MCLTVVLARYLPLTTAQRGATPPVPALTSPPIRPAGTVGSEPGRVWDIQNEDALATAPMPVLPLEASQPQPLSQDVAGPPIQLPTPSPRLGQWTADAGLPATPEGALAQLAELASTALRGADPDTVERAYGELSSTDGPVARDTQLYRFAVDFRAHAGLPATGPVPGLTVTFTPVEGLIKGTADGGDFVVACVLGEFAADYQTRSAKAGIGDCQALRFDGGRWQVSPTRLAAAAPNAWPGSRDAVRVGYRELRHVS